MSWNLRALILILLLGFSAPAGAVEVGFFEAYFEDLGTGFGVAESNAQADTFGVPIFVREDLVPDTSYPVAAGTDGQSFAGTARIFTLSSLAISDPEFSNFDEALRRVTATYTGVTLPDDLPAPREDEDVYLLFATSSGPYESRDVGIDVEEILIQTVFGEDSYLFYPAVKLTNGGNDDRFSVNILLDAPFQFDGDSAIIPGLVVGAAYVTVIPEPSTALLLGLGLVLVARRRRLPL